MREPDRGAVEPDDRLGEQLESIGHRFARTRVDGVGEPHQLLTPTLAQLLDDAIAQLRTPVRERDPHRARTGLTGGTPAGDVHVVDGVEPIRGMAYEHIGETGRESRADHDRDPQLPSLRIEVEQLTNRGRVVARGDAGHPGLERIPHNGDVVAGGNRARHAVHAVGK